MHEKDSGDGEVKRRVARVARVVNAVYWNREIVS